MAFGHKMSELSCGRIGAGLLRGNETFFFPGCGDLKKHIPHQRGIGTPYHRGHHHQRRAIRTDARLGSSGAHGPRNRVSTPLLKLRISCTGGLIPNAPPGTGADRGPSVRPNRD